MYEFFASLPALLGILGFVVFYFLQQNTKGDTATLKIVEKLRQEKPERFKPNTKLNSKQLFELLSSDTNLREKISNQDFKLLQQALKQQHTTTLVVYSLCSILFIVGAILFAYQINKPEPVSISDINVSSSNSLAKGLAVDLDDLNIHWIASGEPTELTVFMENIDTKDRSNTRIVRSNDGSVELLQKDYLTIIKNREFPKWNRVRVIFQSKEQSFYSAQFKLFVGLKITAVNFGEKVTIAAVIDNHLVQDYKFDAKLVAWQTDGLDAISIGGEIRGLQNYPILNSELYNWASAKLAYLGSDDMRKIRTEVISD